VKFKGKPFIVFFIVVFCLVGLEAQTVLIHIRSTNPTLVKEDIGEVSSYPCQGHGCGCRDADDCRNHCCCSQIAVSDVPVQPGIPYFAKTLHCRGVHTDIPVNLLTQYEPLIELKARFGHMFLTILPTQQAKKPLEPCLSPPYKPPEESILS
jgi:hypothetical protein